MKNLTKILCILSQRLPDFLHVDGCVISIGEFLLTTLCSQLFLRLLIKNGRLVLGARGVLGALERLFGAVVCLEWLLFAVEVLFVASLLDFGGPGVFTSDLFSRWLHFYLKNRMYLLLHYYYIELN